MEELNQNAFRLWRSGQRKESLDHHQEALNICLRIVNTDPQRVSDVQLSILLYHVAYSLNELGLDIKEAKILNEKALEIRMKIGNKKDILKCQTLDYNISQKLI